LGSLGTMESKQHPPHPRTSHIPRALYAVLVTFFALALFYNWSSPIFENSDEFFHFPLVKHLADTNWYLPVQSPDDLQDWRQQGNQPPIYHMIAALLIKPFDTSDYDEVRRINPHAQLGIVGESNINAVIHPLDRNQEWSNGTALALRVVRLLSTVLAMVVIVSAYFLTIYTFPNIPQWVGVLAAALIAFNPMYLFVASSVNNDNMSNALICSMLVILVWMYRQPEKPPVRVMLGLGVLLGFSMLSKLSTGPFMLLVGLYWLLLAWRHQAWEYMIKWGVATLGLALLISGWWYIRNWQLYGDPTGLSMFLDIVGPRPIPLTAEQLWSEREGFMQSFWGLFGGLTVPMDGWVYTGFNLLMGISILGVVVYAVQHWREIDLPQWTLPLWALMAGISIIRWTALTWATQGRLWYIAITALAVLSAVGFYTLAERIKLSRLAWLPVAYALIAAVVAPIIFISPAYAAPAFSAREDYAEPILTLSDPSASEQQISLVTFTIPEQFKSGTDTTITLTWCAETTLVRNWSVFVHLVNPFDIILAQADYTPGLGAVPTSEVNAGDCWQDKHPIRIGAGVSPEDIPLQVMIGMYEAQSGQRMVDDSNADRIALQETQLIVGDALQQFALGDVVRVTSYALSDNEIQAGNALTVTLTWDVLAPLTQDYTVFVQVLDLPTAYRAGASDQMPNAPTTTWAVGDQITDTHTFTIAEDAPAGVYAVIVGMYYQPEPGNFARLRLSYDGVDTGFDALTLTQIRVD